MPEVEGAQETEESTEETVEEEPEGTSEETAEQATEEPAAEAAEVSPQKPSNEMKVVIVLKDEKIMMGVQSPTCDPVYKTMEGTLAQALKKVPALVSEAKQKWETNPRNPKADLPAPPPSLAPTRPSPAARSSQPAAKPTFF